jgi:hypothetical protein
MTTTTSPAKTRAPLGARRFGYLVAVLVNVVMLVVVNNILDWGWLPFLTDDFEAVVWLINLSLTASILANLAYMAYDPVWFRSITQVVLNLISIAVLVTMWQVFPFDFSAYEFAWDTLVRFVLVLGIVGTVIGTVAELVKMTRSLTSAPATGQE